MRDRILILAALGVFLLLAGYPALRAVAAGSGPRAPVLAKSVVREACVRPPAEMRASHMRLLAEWRDLAVRQGIRQVTMTDGRTWKVSLQATCLRCHAEKEKFCDRCHEYAGVQPECWDCHGAAASPGTVSRGRP